MGNDGERRRAHDDIYTCLSFSDHPTKKTKIQPTRTTDLRTWEFCVHIYIYVCGLCCVLVRLQLSFVQARKSASSSSFVVWPLVGCLPLPTGAKNSHNPHSMLASRFGLSTAFLFMCCVHHKERIVAFSLVVRPCCAFCRPGVVRALDKKGTEARRPRFFCCFGVGTRVLRAIPIY